jgi:hypothetical protein
LLQSSEQHSSSAFSVNGTASSHLLSRLRQLSKAWRRQGTLAITSFAPGK